MTLQSWVDLKRPRQTRTKTPDTLRALRASQLPLASSNTVGIDRRTEVSNQRAKLVERSNDGPKRHNQL